MIKIRIFCNIIYVFTVARDQLQYQWDLDGHKTDDDDDSINSVSLYKYRIVSR